MRTPFSNGADLKNQKAVNLAPGTNANDAVTFQQLSDALQGITGSKEPVRVAAPGNVNLSSPGTTIDGTTMANGDRFLAPSQTTGTQNGIYVFNGSSSVATRAPDANTQGEVRDGTVVSVAEGTNAGFLYMQQNTPSGAPGAWTENWVKYIQGTTYVGGTGITISGSTISLTTPVSVANGGTGGTSATTARQNLGALTSEPTTIGDGSTTDIVVPHPFGTTDVWVASLREISTGEEWIPHVVGRTTTNITLRFGTAPANNSMRVITAAKA